MRFALLLPLLPLLAACSDSGVDKEAIRRGTVIFENCAACHALDGKAVIGPPLNGVVGRKVGSVPGFAYSDAFRNGGFTWTPEKLSAFLQNPESIPGTNMVATPLSEQDANDVVALLQSRG
jgi:cytochrome c